MFMKKSNKIIAIFLILARIMCVLRVYLRVVFRKEVLVTFWLHAVKVSVTPLCSNSSLLN